MESDTWTEAEFSLKCTCIAAPYQFEGIVHGKRLYFRSRHNRTRVDIDGVTILERGQDVDTVVGMLRFLADAIDVSGVDV